MTIDRKARAAAGATVLVSLGLSRRLSPYGLSLAGFVGPGAILASPAGFRPLARALEGTGAGRGGASSQALDAERRAPTRDCSPRRSRLDSATFAATSLLLMRDCFSTIAPAARLERRP